MPDPSYPPHWDIGKYREPNLEYVESLTTCIIDSHTPRLGNTTYGAEKYELANSIMIGILKVIRNFFFFLF